MIAVLITLVALFSVLTIKKQSPDGAPGGRRLAEQIEPGSAIIVVAKDTPEDQRFAAAFKENLGGSTVIATVFGEPFDFGTALADPPADYDVIAAAPSVAGQIVFDKFVASGKKLVTPTKKNVCVFLGLDNLSNVASRITVIAIIAIGMTMVIITAGIDLSVGSLIALSAVVTCWLIAKLGGGYEASTFVVIACCLCGILACAAAGAFTGSMVNHFSVPPFIATLAMMLMIRGIAFKITNDETIDRIPASFDWLGNGNTFGLPNSVILMVILYLIAHVIMSRTKLGRYIYAVGGNPEAARLSGVPVKRIKMIAYTTCGALAGLGGIILASRFKSAAANIGQSYELEVIAAVIVGGTSLFGGRGKVFGTLIGAFIIGVIQNGMNLIGLRSQDQLIALGAVILIAVILERIRSGEWKSATGG